MFKTHYEFFGSTLVCDTFQTSVDFSLESRIYSYVKREFQNNGWKFIRIDTVNQQAFPDILLLRKEEYLLMEAKLLKKRKLLELKDDLKWQFGQLAFMKNAIRLEHNYTLAVACGNTIAYIRRQ